jgi:hypothetical protein
MTGTDSQQPATEPRAGQHADARRFLDGVRIYEAGPWATFISLLALILSGVSIYQTTLKQPMPTLYMSGTVRFGYDGQRNEIFAVPMTIVNHGPRDAVITRVTLSVIKSGTPNSSPVVFASTHFGDEPKQGGPLFTPISIAGHGSFSGSIVFARNAPEAGAAIPGRDRYQFCVSIRTETGDDVGILSDFMTFRPSALRFTTDVPYFDKSQLERGQDISLAVTNIERVATTDNTSDLPICK